ncbi:MAG: hypothetical protein ACKVKF_22955, partial [Rhodobacterales bacterium]
DEQISAIASGLDPARLMPSPEADRGAPIVGPDSVIESGNGRIGALERAYQMYPDRADAYRRQIADAGFPIPEGIDQPVLIARRTSEMDSGQRQGFVRAANQSQLARMSATERAGVDARGLNSQTIGLFNPAHGLDTIANRDFTRAVLNTIPQAERAGLVDAAGAVNAEGARRIRDALFARAYDAPDIIARYAETEAGPLKSLMDALVDAAPHWAALRNAVADGRVRPEMDITPFVLDAMRTIALARELAARDGGKIGAALENMLAQTDAFVGDTAPLTVALIRKFAPGGRTANKEKIADFLKRYADEAQKIGGTERGLFDAPGPLDALKAIDRSAFSGLTEIGRAAVPAAPTRDLQLQDMPEGAFADGASSPEVLAANQSVLDELRASLQTRQLTQAEDQAIEQMLETQIRTKTSLTPEQQKRIDQSYAANGADDVAQLIRSGLVAAPQEMTLYRGFAGSDVAPDGLLSFSASQKTAANFGRVETVTIPAGTPIYSPRSGISGGEVLVPRETYEGLTGKSLSTAPTDPAPTPAIAQAAAPDRQIMDELRAFADEGIELDNGTRVSMREFLDDIDADEALETVISLCGVKG